MIHSTKIAQKGDLLNKGAARALDKKCIQTAFPLESLFLIKYCFTVMFGINHYFNCTNGLEALNKKAAKAIDKKYL